MVLKVDGQNIPIYDYQDAVAFAQKGVHYTQAMQQLSQHRQTLMALESHPDLKDELMRRLRGGVPATAKEPEKPKGQEPEFAIPPMGDTETHEEWISRVFKESLPQMIQRKAEQIAAQKAAEAVGAATAGMEESQRRNRIMEAIKADPLRDATIREMRSAIEGGQIPEAIVLAADQAEALEVIASKISRMLTGDPQYRDNWHDIVGYAKLVDDRMAEAEKPAPKAARR